MTGKVFEGFTCERPRRAVRTRLRASRFGSAGDARGFTLLELMIVISILVILAMIAVAQYNKTVLAAKEATLRENLYQMNKMIDQYGADKGKLPQSLDDLVTAGYIQEVPVDPIMERNEWNVEYGDDPGSTDNSQGIKRVRSLSNDVSSDGQTRYSDW